MKYPLATIGILLFAVLLAVPRATGTEGFDDLVKVIKSGADDKALAAYIDASPVAYNLSVDEILFLNDLGVSAAMIQAINDHWKNLAQGSAESAPSPAAPVSAPAPEAEGAPPAVSFPPPEDTVQEEVDDAPDVEAPPPDQATVSTFYDALSPYGSWIDVDGDWYWQPTAMVVNSSWSPYCQSGHWVYTDCGWFWQSDYSWGWAPFHYGRWTRHPRYGWIWMPDTVWAPAWVSWRHSDDVIGWAPLPPVARYDVGVGFSLGGAAASADFEFGLDASAYTFVAVAHFGDPRLAAVLVPRSEVQRIYARTALIHDSYVREGDRIVNRGPPVARIMAVTHQTIAQIRIVDQGIQPGHPIRRGRISGGTVSVYRPHVAATAPMTPQAVVQRRQAEALAKRNQTPRGSLLDSYGSRARINEERARGTTSLQNAHPGPRSPAPPGPSTSQVSSARGPAPAATAAARQQQEQRQRAAQLARQQEEQRRALETQRQAEEAAARQREEQQRRAAELAQQEEQRRRAVEQARQQEAQRPAAEQAEPQRRAQEQAQEEQRQRAAQLARQQEEQRQVWQAQRQAEETAARQQAPARSPPPPAPPRVQQSAFQGYGNGSAAVAASNRGSASRGDATNQRRR